MLDTGLDRGGPGGPRRAAAGGRGAAARRRHARAGRLGRAAGRVPDRQRARPVPTGRSPDDAVLRRRRVAGAVGLRPDRGAAAPAPGSTWPSRSRRPAARSTSGPPTWSREIVPGAGRAAAGGPGRRRCSTASGDPGAHRDVPARHRAAPPCGRRPTPGCRASRWPGRGPTPAGRRRWRARSARGHAAADDAAGAAGRSGGGTVTRRGRAGERRSRAAGGGGPARAEHLGDRGIPLRLGGRRRPAVRLRRHRRRQGRCGPGWRCCPRGPPARRPRSGCPARSRSSCCTTSRSCTTT